VRDARSYGPKSPQPEYPPEVTLIRPELTDSGEDYLTLNVWTPDTDAAARPVAVWIPGGVFEFHGTSASPWYDGSRFARDGVVCVTISSRVGADGFLALDDGVANVRVPCGPSRRHPRRPARGRPDRPVLARSRPPPGRRARDALVGGRGGPAGQGADLWEGVR